MTYQTCLWPARSNATHNRFGGRRLACSCSRCRFGSSRSWLVNVSEDRAIVVVVLRQQGSDFAQFLGRLLQHLDLLAQLCVLGLLPTQDLVDNLHATPLFKNSRGNRARVNE